MNFQAQFILAYMNVYITFLTQIGSDHTQCPTSGFLLSNIYLGNCSISAQITISFFFVHSCIISIIFHCMDES